MSGAAPGSSTQRASHDGWPVAALMALIWVGGLVAVVVGYGLARVGSTALALLYFYTGVVAVYASAVAVLLRQESARGTRQLALQLLGLGLLVADLALTPLRYTSFDELLHQRTLLDIDRTLSLFSPNPLLTVSPYYPGLEALTAQTERLLGLPRPGAILLVLVLCRVLLLAGFARFADSLGGPARAGVLAAALYATSPQFFSFNAMYAYQTLALSLGVCGVCALRSAQAAATTRRRRERTAVAVVLLTSTAVTHHVTSWLTSGLVLVWLAALLVQRAPRTHVRPVAWAAGATGLATAAWTAFVGRRLSSYLAPVFGSAAEQVASLLGGDSSAGRQLFHDGGGDATPLWEVAVMLAAALMWCLLIALAGLPLARRALGDRKATWALLVVIAAVYPVTIAVRFSPAASELGDRSSSFLYFGMALVVAPWMLRSSGLLHRRNGALTALVSVMFLGGLLLGSGPDWARLPGPYLVSADARSIDAPVQQAVHWVSEELPAGSRFLADRDAGALLASTAGAWPVTQANSGTNAGLLYFADQWGPEQQRAVERHHIQYVWTDLRLATDLPRVGVYVEPGESPAPERLTVGQLTKFEKIPGARTVYSSGPIRIYDLEGSGVVPEQTRQPARAPRPWPAPLAVGLAIGIGVVALRRGLAPVRTLEDAWFVTTGAVGAACWGSVALVGMHVAVTPLTGFVAVCVVGLDIAWRHLHGNRRRAGDRRRHGGPRRSDDRRAGTDRRTRAGGRHAARHRLGSPEPHAPPPEPTGVGIRGTRGP